MREKRAKREENKSLIRGEKENEVGLRRHGCARFEAFFQEQDRIVGLLFMFFIFWDSNWIHRETGGASGRPDCECRLPSIGQLGEKNRNIQILPSASLGSSGGGGTSFSEAALASAAAPLLGTARALEGRSSSATAVVASTRPSVFEAGRRRIVATFDGRLLRLLNLIGDFSKEV